MLGNEGLKRNNSINITFSKPTATERNLLTSKAYTNSNNLTYGQYVQSNVKGSFEFIIKANFVQGACNIVLKPYNTIVTSLNYISYLVISIYSKDDVMLKNNQYNCSSSMSIDLNLNKGDKVFLNLINSYPAIPESIINQYGNNLMYGEDVVKPSFKLTSLELYAKEKIPQYITIY